MPQQGKLFYDYSPTVRIHYESIGQGRDVVLLHGFGASIDNWTDVRAPLQEHLHLYMVDLKGHGLSSRPLDGKYSLADQADIVVALMKHLCLRKVLLVGHSYGGAVALMTYLKLCQDADVKITGLILIDAPAYPQAFPFFLSVMTRPVLSMLTGLLPAHFRATYTLNQAFYDRSKLRDDIIDRYARYLHIPGSQYVLSEVIDQLVPANVTEFIAGIKTISSPTLILWGEEDRLVPLSSATRLNHDIAKSELITLPKCGHVPQEECPKRTAEVLMSFMRGVPE
jgi:pimeloyl-ACP methyl ester carboxylesterase